MRLDDERGRRACRARRLRGGVGAETMVSSLRTRDALVEAYLDDERGPGSTLSISQREWPTVVISVPHSGQVALLGRHGIHRLRRARGERGTRRVRRRMAAGLRFSGCGLESASSARRRLRRARAAGERQHELALEALERLGARALAAQLGELLRELAVDLAHARDEGDDRGDQLHELERRGSSSRARRAPRPGPARTAR